ncbi:CAAD domain-containing protein [Leptolyngbya sp. FACHB-321]|uniref:CAAD domain-containing protein n=1 Tax=Leptolyngbya sp. FACHB-321 TaxID=2692807 RepID=UPI0016830410|nr:CAAD domain-containing protein [Leptolyngbya sp. FACHB-321]MBD2033709.1 CAAD domain-containing protein [Leptolyngbya sp. FACHB-321]
MSTEVVTTNEYGEVEEVMSVDGSSTTDPMLMEAPATPDTVIQETATATTDAADAAGEAWASFQVKANAFLAKAIQSTGTFLEQNKQLLSVLGWTLLTLLGIRVVFAALDAIDDIPLVTPVLKLIGLATVAWFIWRYLLRANNRHELSQMFNNAKAELFGDQS